MAARDAPAAVAAARGLRGRGRIEKDIFNVLFLFLAFPEKRNMLYCTLKVWKGSRRRVCHKTVEPKQRMKSVPQEGRKARDG